MKKTLIASAVLGIVSLAVHAQSHVTVYGLVDTGLIKETGRDVRMGNNIESRLGFKGTEALGNGNQAFFVLENASISMTVRWARHGTMTIIRTGGMPTGRGLRLSACRVTGARYLWGEWST